MGSRDDPQSAEQVSTKLVTGRVRAAVLCSWESFNSLATACSDPPVCYIVTSVCGRRKICMNMYHTNGLTITQLNTDNGFTCIADDICCVVIHMVVAE